jgi:hypothetical protein
MIRGFLFLPAFEDQKHAGRQVAGFDHTTSPISTCKMFAIYCFVGTLIPTGLNLSEIHDCAVGRSLLGA